MSTSTTVTPYENPQQLDQETAVTGELGRAVGEVIGAGLVVAVGGTVALLSLLRTTEAERELLRQRQKKELRSEVIPLALPATHLDSLVQRAEELGYRRVALVSGTGVRLERSGDPSIELHRTAAGKIEAYAPPLALDTVVQYHMAAQGVELLRSRGMEVRVMRHRNGEIRLQGTRRPAPGHTAPLTVTTGLRANGTVNIDVSGVKGPACSPLVRDLALAMGTAFLPGRTKKKAEYYQASLSEEDKYRVTT